MIKPRTIFLYTIMHTGSWFARFLFYTTFPYENILDMPKYREKHKENSMIRNLREDITPEEFKSYFLSAFSEEEKNTAKLILLNTHYGTSQPILLDSIKANSTNIPFVSTLRDPLLILNTNKYRHPDTYDAQAFVQKLVEQILNLTKLSQDKIFLLPVDLPRVYKPKIENLFNFCQLTMTSDTEKYIDKWIPKNQTTNISPEYSTYAVCKNAILSNDINTIEHNFSIEFSYLQEQQALKDKFYELGYRNLSWW